MNALKKAIDKARDRAPRMTLAPKDAAQGTHPKPGGSCGAIAQFSGEEHDCSLKLGHPGDHSSGGKNDRTWRPRSGDARE